MNALGASGGPQRAAQVALRAYPVQADAAPGNGDADSFGGFFHAGGVRRGVVVVLALLAQGLLNHQTEGNARLADGGLVQGGGRRHVGKRAVNRGLVDVDGYSHLTGKT